MARISILEELKTVTGGSSSDGNFVQHYQVGQTYYGTYNGEAFSIYIVEYLGDWNYRIRITVEAEGYHDEETLAFEPIITALLNNRD